MCRGLWWWSQRSVQEIFSGSWNSSQDAALNHKFMEARAARWNDWGSMPKLDGSCEVPRLSPTTYQSGEPCGVGSWSGVSTHNSGSLKSPQTRDGQTFALLQGRHWLVEFACNLYGAMFLEPCSSGRPAWCHHHEGKRCISWFALSQTKREPTAHLWRTLKDCAPSTQSWPVSPHACMLCLRGQNKGHYTQSHYLAPKRIPPKYWARKGGVLKSVFIPRFGPK